MAKKWRCTVCGYIHEGPEAPDQCPMCKVGKEKFVEVEEKAGGLDFVTEHKLGDGKGASQELWEGLNNHFMGECSEVGQYLAMARQADREGYPEIAEAFKRYAWEEAEHASKFAELIGDIVWDTKTNLFKRMNAECGACEDKMRLARLATPVFEEDYPFEIGKANVLREGKDAAVFACGLMVNEALEAAKLLAAEGIEISVINVHTIKPIDAECVTKYAEKCGNVITVEEHSVIGGLGDAVADALMGKVCCKFRKIGVNDQFGQSGKAADVLREYGLTADQIAATIKANI